MVSNRSTYEGLGFLQLQGSIRTRRIMWVILIGSSFLGEVDNTVLSLDPRCLPLSHVVQGHLKGDAISLLTLANASMWTFSYCTDFERQVVQILIATQTTIFWGFMASDYITAWPNICHINMS